MTADDGGGAMITGGSEAAALLGGVDGTSIVGVCSEGLAEGDVDVTEPAGLERASDLDGAPEHDVQNKTTTTINAPNTIARRRQ
jgi:hypothetical protein